VNGDQVYAGLINRLRQISALPPDLPVTVTALSGGVSNDVLAVTGSGVDIVVKRALPRLRVEAEWLASPARVVTEAHALQLAAAIRPGLVPGVRAVDAENFIVVIERAPRSFIEWRRELLDSRVDTAVARCLGSSLAGWHRATTGNPRLTSEFADTASFEELRVDPFYRTVASRNPALAGEVGAVVDRMLATRRCLVHGDFSPKNVLHGDDAVWVIDWEVAHLGDPVFDLAFMISHLVCKSLRRPGDAAALRRAADGFLAAYLEGAAVEVDPVYLAHQTACLVLARIDGKSPATYLDEDARRRGHSLAHSLLKSPAPAWDAFWNH
jgi:5-methylthioribose kinase